MKRTILAAICAAAVCGGAAAAHDNGNPNGNHPHHGDHGDGGNGGNGGQGGNGGDASAAAASSASSSSSSGASASTSTHVGGDDAAASSAASLYLSGCGAGASAQGMSFGASLGAESRLCQRLRLVAAYQALGMHFQAATELREAARELNGGATEPSEAPFYYRASQSVGRVLRAIVAPLPFIGHGA